MLGLVSSIVAIFVLSPALRASDDYFCESFLSDLTIQAAHYTIDLGEENEGMGSIVGQDPKKVPNPEPKPSEKIRGPELELPLQIVPTGERKKPQRPPSKRPQKYNIN